MPDLQFSDTQSFDQNLENFLMHMESIDDELGNILRARIDKLKGALDETTRRDARTGFNDSVVSTLDELIPSDEEA